VYWTLHTNECLPPEQPAALPEIASPRVEAVLQGEHGAIPSAEILGATQAPAGRQFACHARHTEHVVARGIRMRYVFDARIDDSVQRHARLRDRRRACRAECTA
jgi:hypothetical protein